jgi:hypothetical protein
MDNIYDQKGAGGMPVYYGARYLRGMGIGSMFKGKHLFNSIHSIATLLHSVYFIAMHFKVVISSHIIHSIIS